MQMLDKLRSTSIILWVFISLACICIVFSGYQLFKSFNRPKPNQEYSNIIPRIEKLEQNARQYQLDYLINRRADSLKIKQLETQIYIQSQHRNRLLNVYDSLSQKRDKLAPDNFNLPKFN